MKNLLYRLSTLALPLLLLVTMGSQATASAITRPKPGVMVIYSQQGRYNSVRVQATNAAYKTTTDPQDPKPALKCGGAFSATPDKHFYTRSLPTTRSGSFVLPRSLKCTAVDANNQYAVKFGKNNNFDNGPSTLVDVDENECVHVVPGRAPSDGGVVAANGTCNNITGENDTPDRVGAHIEVAPILSKNNRYISGTVKVTGDENLLRVQCAGSVTVTYTSGKTTAPIPLRYVKATSGDSYCRAKFNSNTLSSANKLTPGNYYVSAHLDQTAYLYAADGTGPLKTIPPRP